MFEVKKFSKGSHAPWFVLLGVAYAGMVLASSFSFSFSFAAVCAAVICGVAYSIYAIGEAMGRDGYNLPESRKARRVANENALTTDVSVVDRAA